METRNGHTAQHTIRGNETRVIDMTATRAVFGAGFESKTYRVILDNPTPRLNGRACTDPDNPVDPEMFHPGDMETLALAQAVCKGCPVRERCLDLAIARGEWGVWGGVLFEAGQQLERPRVPGRPSSKKSQEAASLHGLIA